ncbi:MAG: segregation and condensation protein [Patescibacteria group bacterium]|nr:segregation and condensation protein [Patescibacteria group bacterium]
MDLESILEGILFALNQPFSSDDLSKLVKKPVSEVEAALQNLQQFYEMNQRGLKLLSHQGQWLLTVRPDLSPYLEKLKKETLEGDLTPAAAETLAIIAYRGPLSRLEINELRGVDSSYLLHQLLLRELIERFPNPQRANSFLYQVSFKFLEHLGLTKVEDLPDYDKLHQKNFAS